MRITRYDLIKWCIISALLAIITACSSSKHVTQTVERTSVDTIYLNTKQYDSIYIYQDRSTEYRPDLQSRITNHSSLIATDTVYLKDVSVEYRYKLLRDTVKVTKRDSIPYEVTVVETKEITRPLTWFDRLCRTCFYFLLGILFCWLFSKIPKR